MSFKEKIEKIQEDLGRDGLDGWLLYDFQGMNEHACHLLELPLNTVYTRRLFYWIPRRGQPEAIVSKLQECLYKHLPGKIHSYLNWHELEESLGKVLKGRRRIAMEYSPRNGVPYVSRVDAGTMEVVKGFGVEVVSSSALLQRFNGVWDEDKMRSHVEVAAIFEVIYKKAYLLISDYLSKGKTITEYEVLLFVMKEFIIYDCISEYNMIVAVNEHSVDPYFNVRKETAKSIKKGDYLLLSLSGKKNSVDTVYVDVARVAVADTAPTPLQQEVFDLLKRARKAALKLMRDRFKSGDPLYGYEVDEVSREVIEKGGYGQYCTHRVGHNIDVFLHGSGTHLDNFEIRDTREILPGTCFALGPGIYIPGKFGMRVENDIFVDKDRKVIMTTGDQQEITCLL
ncbi:aminopeptidase P family protein [Simkania negevensis]|uniref:Aminopeptidase P family protein n=1 Tax=Simkania negevensis TaxID=83561 RepID=A0ABS3AU43_9BACT|nr:aminopeptidase P family protein [Simkania negevensis]